MTVSPKLPQPPLLAWVASTHASVGASLIGAPAGVPTKGAPPGRLLQQVVNPPANTDTSRTAP